MNIRVCDLCRTDPGELVEGATVPLQLDDQVREIDLCAACLDRLDTLLAPFAEAGRIPLGHGRRCAECGLVSPTTSAAAKHRRRHQVARERGALAAAS